MSEVLREPEQSVLIIPDLIFQLGGQKAMNVFVELQGLSKSTFAGGDPYEVTIEELYKIFSSKGE